MHLVIWHLLLLQLFLCILPKEAPLILLVTLWWNLILTFPVNWSDVVVVGVLASHLPSFLNRAHLLLQMMRRNLMRESLTCSLQSREVLFELAHLTITCGGFIASAQNSCWIASEWWLCVRLGLWLLLVALLKSLPGRFALLGIFGVGAMIACLRALVDHLNFLDTTALHTVVWISGIREDTLDRWSTWSWSREGRLALLTSRRWLFLC